MTKNRLANIESEQDINFASKALNDGFVDCSISFCDNELAKLYGDRADKLNEIKELYEELEEIDEYISNMEGIKKCLEDGK